MNKIESAIEYLSSTLPTKVDYADLVCAEGGSKGCCYVYENPEPYWIEMAIEVLKEKQEREENIGETSDGYHTFNELYHHRAILFSVICNSNSELAWKSKKHNDGTMFENMFIVGINTPQGQATYHYDTEPYWDMFNVKEIDNAPIWDGHTPTQACERILSINENKALTLEELENMIGEPVWVHGHHQIIHCVDKENNLIWVSGFGASYKFKNHSFYKYKPKYNE